jgi:hypothetical protein
MESTATVYGGGVTIGGGRRLLAAIGAGAVAFGGAFAAGSVLKSSSAAGPAKVPALAAPTSRPALTIAIPAVRASVGVPQLRPATTVTPVVAQTGGAGTGTRTGTGAGTGTGNSTHTYHYTPPNNGIQHGQDGGKGAVGTGSGIAHGHV